MLGHRAIGAVMAGFETSRWKRIHARCVAPAHKVVRLLFAATAGTIMLVAFNTSVVAADGDPVVLDVSLDVGGSAVGAEWPYVAPGEEVTWNYAVTNTGDRSLSGLTISDAVSGEVCAISELLPAATQECKRVMVAGETMYATTVRVLHIDSTANTSAASGPATLAQSTTGIQVLVGQSGGWRPAAVGATPEWPVERWAPPAGVALILLTAVGWWLNRQIARRQEQRQLIARRARVTPPR